MKSRTVTALFLAALTLFAFSAFAKTVAHSHGMRVSGKITALDEGAKTMSVTPAKGSAVALTWNDATNVKGGSLKSGESVDVRYLRRNSKNVATVVTVAGEKKAAAAPKPAAAATAAKPVAAKSTTTTKTTTATKHAPAKS